MDIVKRKLLGLTVKTELTVLYCENQKKTAHKTSDKTSQLLPFNIFLLMPLSLGLHQVLECNPLQKHKNTAVSDLAFHHEGHFAVEIPVPQREKFHTDDVNQCLHNQFWSHEFLI